MAERFAKRSRQVSTDDSDSEGTDDWSPQNSGLNAARRGSPSHEDVVSSRSRRRPAAAAAAAARQKPDPVSKRPIRLTVKAPPSRLRQVMDAEPARESLSRSSKNKRAVYQEPSEEEDEDDVEDEEEGVDENGEAEGEDEEDDEEEQEEDEEDAEAASEDDSADDASEIVQVEGDDEGEDDEDDEDEDEEMRDVSAEPPRPSIRLRAPTANDRDRPRGRGQSPRGKLAREGKLKSVEEKEIQMAGSGAGNSDDEELSDADSDDEEEEEEEEEEDASEEPDDEDLPNDALDTIRASAIGDDELSDDSISSSRAGTPDPTKLTRRQRGIDETGLMALSNEAQKKKVFTAQEITMRRAEMARRRKDLSEKRNEEEKADTLNRLLHKQAPKRRTRAQILAEAEREEFGTPALEEGEVPKAKATYVRTVMTVDGTLVGVPEEWLGKPVGSVFENLVQPSEEEPKVLYGSRMVQVIEETTF